MLDETEVRKIDGIIIMHDTNWHGVGDAINLVFKIKNDWKTDFQIISDRANIINRRNNYGLACIYLIS